jgi:hypothetical protein
METERYGTYEAFWPFYVSQHLNATNRRLHFTGTTFVLLSVLAALGLHPAWLLVAPFAGYGFAWVGHYFVEKNRPATFTYPLWSLRADFRMYRLMVVGAMGPEIARARQLGAVGR